MTTVSTMCPMNCHPTLCGMTVTVDGPGAVRIAGDPDHPDSEGFLCMRGKAAHQIVGNPERLMQPLIRARKGGDLAPASWDDALNLIADRMARAGREAVGLWQSHGNAVNDYGFGLKRGQFERFGNLYGCQHWNPAMICWGMGGFGLGLTGALETSTKEDMGDNSALILLWGANTVSQANTMRHVDRAKRRGARIVVIDVRRTEVSALADQTVLVRPGTDAMLALAMMHVIVAEGMHDPAFVEAYTLGYEDLAAHVAGWSPARAAALTGVDADTIADLARSYARTTPAMIVLGGSSIHKGPNAWHAARAISCLPGLTGQFGIPGGGIGPRHGGRCRGAPVVDVSAADRRPPGRYIPNQMSAIADAIATGEVKVLLSIGSNILSSFPDARRMERALSGLDLFAVYDIFANPAARELADVILPGTIWLEEIGAKATNTHIYLCDRALEPAGEARPAIDIWRGLADRLGVADVYPWEDQEAAMNAALDQSSTGHVTVERLRTQGGRQALAVSHVAYPDRRFDTPSGRIEFRSARTEAMGLPGLPEAADDTKASADYPLRLAHGRTYAHFHAFYDHGRALPDLAAREAGPQVWVAPEDAAARGIADGATVRLSSAQGTFDAEAKVTRRMQPGAVWMRDGWPGANALTSGAPVLPEAALGAFPFSVGQSDFGAEVEIAPV